MKHGCHCQSSSLMYGNHPPDGTSCSGKCSLSDFVVTGSVGGFGRTVAGSSRSLTLAPGCSCRAQLLGQALKDEVIVL